MDFIFLTYSRKLQGNFNFQEVDFVRLFDIANRVYLYPILNSVVVYLIGVAYFSELNNKF